MFFLYTIALYPWLNMVDLSSNRDCWHEFCQSFLQLPYLIFINILGLLTAGVIMIWFRRVSVLFISYKFLLGFIFSHGFMGICMLL